MGEALEDFETIPSEWIDDLEYAKAKNYLLDWKKDKPMEEKILALQAAFDELTDKYLDVLERIQSFLEDDDMESASDLLQSIIDGVKSATGGVEGPAE